MLDPRPEMSTATRARSAMVIGGPGVGRAPRAGAAFDRAAARASRDRTDAVDGLARALEGFGDRIGLGCRDDRDHSDAAVEGPRHFRGRDVTALLHEGEDARQDPFVHFYHRMAILCQNSRNILEKAAAGDMRNAVDSARPDGRQ